MKRLLVLLILLTSLAPITWAPSVALGREPAPLTVFAANDFHGALLGKVYSWSQNKTVGGMAWLAGYLDTVRRENPGGVLYLDGGDLMQGSFVSRHYDGAPSIALFNAMELKAAAVGNHEFDWGLKVLAERAKQANFPLLGANIQYKDTGKRPEWAKDFVIVEVQGVKVGVVGVANPDTARETMPTSVTRLEFTDPAKAVAKYIPEMEKQGATMVVVLAHIGGTPPGYPEGIKDLACALDSSKVDMVVSGHTHTRIAAELCGIPVVQAGSHSQAFSRVDFFVDPATGEAKNHKMNKAPTIVVQGKRGKDGAPATYRRWDNGKSVAVLPNPKVEAMVERYETLIAATKNTVLGETTAAITRALLHESAMGDWVADIMRTSVPDADFALLNGGALRTDLAAGKITYGQVYDVLIYDDTLYVSKLSGKEVRLALEQGVSGKHRLVQVSGLKFTVDFNLPPLKRIRGKVTDVRTGKSLDPDKTYGVVINDFMASGGDGFAVLKTSPKTDTGLSLRDLTMEWVKAHSPFTAPNPATEKRIIVQNLPSQSQQENERREKASGYGL